MVVAMLRITTSMSSKTSYISGSVIDYRLGSRRYLLPPAR
jgi:hypothetical protein